MGGNVRGRRTKRAECPRLPGAVRAPRTNSAGCPHVDKNTPGVRWRRTEGGYSLALYSTKVHIFKKLFDNLQK